MTLRDLLAGAGFGPWSPLASLTKGRAAARRSKVEISGLAYDSRAVKPGSLFFCIRGFNVDGHDFAADAVEAGAAAIVCERPLGAGTPELVVADVRAVMAPIAAVFHGSPSEELLLVGVTGTNGKTTTCFLMRQILEAAGFQTGLLGTVESIVGGKREDVVRTTPEAPDLHHTLRRMLGSGDRACVMEVSSHALELHRADAIAFDCVVFTNLTQDHLDFHGTLDRYFGAKRSLFLPQMGPRPCSSVVNLDDEWGRRLAAEVAEAGQTPLVTYAVKNDADFHAERIRPIEGSGSSFVCRTPAGLIDVEIPLVGVFNTYNSVAAIAAASVVGVASATAAQALAGAPQVPGRMEHIDEGQDFTVFVDYAHTPDSLENALRVCRGHLGTKEARLICVFGAGGDRDHQKRPLMGEVARSLAQHVIVTSDNPRSEEPEAIIAEIIEGAERVVEPRGSLEAEADRRTAIARALGEARAGDVVLIAGKGHERGQELADGRKVPFDDRQVARELLTAESPSSAGTAA